MTCKAEYYTNLYSEQNEGHTVTLEIELDRMRRDDPQRFGILRHHFSAVQQAITVCERNYPEARQLYNLLEEPEISSRTFGNILTVLASLGVIGTYSIRNNGNRYDLTQCQCDTLVELGELLSRQSE